MLDYKLFSENLIKKGFERNRALYLSHLLEVDETTCNSDENTKKWALEKGFLPGRVDLYGLTEENYKDYISDYQFFKIFPLNNWTRIWVNDKLTLKYICNNEYLKDIMPRYFLYVENDGNYTYLMDVPKDIPKDSSFILNLLKREGRLAVKPNNGAGGQGFIKFEFINNNILKNNTVISNEEFNNIIKNMNNCIVTEYIEQHHDLAAVWSKSECTLRVIMCKMPRASVSDEPEWYEITSYARFGTSAGVGASNLSQGGVGVGFDFQTGELFENGMRYKEFCRGGQSNVMTVHPDTGFVFKGTFLPNWSYIRGKIYEICSYISSLDYLGFDIIISQNGFKICEINTHPAADTEQVLCGPYLADNKTKDFFKSKGLNAIDNSELLKAYLESQM